MIQALYVDDEQNLLSVSKLFLERTHEMIVDTELSAPRALSRLKTGEYDVVISDYSMPEMDGIMLLKSIRKEYNNKVPFILFTGRGREEVAIEALNFGADYYLQKGGDVKAQFAILRNMILQAAQRKKAENDLKQSEERYRNIVEDQMEFICRFRPDGTHVFVNSAYCSFVGKNRAELIGKKFFPEIPPDDEISLKRHFQSLTLSNPKASIEHRIIMPDGAIRWVRCNDRAIFGKDGWIVEYQSVARDITEQKTAEYARTDTERRLHYIIDFFPDAYYAVDLEGNVIAWNKAAEEMTGIPASQIIGKGNFEYSMAFYGTRHPTLVDLIIHPDKNNHHPYTEIQKTGETTLVTESQITLKDGRRIAIWIKAAPVYDAEGKMAGAVEAIHDVSSYKQLEHERNLVNKKLNLMNMVTRHGIINKQTALMGLLELVKDRTTDAESLRYLRKVQDIATAVGEQIEFTRQYQDLGVKTPSWQNVDERFMYAISHLDLKGCACLRQVDNLEIYADPLLEQVFVNLVENSLLHGGNVTEIRLSFEANGDDTVTLLYEDNGDGIPDREKELIFNQGYGRNSGLGLFLIREILSITRITLRESGTYGKGIRFEITMPKGGYRLIADKKIPVTGQPTPGTSSPGTPGS